ncbi:MAG: DNA polymerase II [Pseudomonadales bacterium]|nr:DNA polymerase II [Pseudomonadales bacterium]NIX08735.1 DNA polymerase II [Pseudomonadales bacterium]
MQATYRVHAGVPVVYLFGRLETGETFLVRDHRQRPHFYVRRQDAERATGVDGITLEPVSARTFSGEPVVRVAVPVPSDAPPARERLHGLGVETFEADVRFAMRYLIDRGIRGGCRVRGPARRGDGVGWILDDPEVSAAEVDVEPLVLSFDIETNAKADRLLGIAVYGAGVDEVLIVDPECRPMPERARGFADERTVLEAFCEVVRNVDPDVLTGWNVIDFDFTVLARIAARVRHPFQLGRQPGGLRIRSAQGYFGSGNATIPGRLVLDGMDLLRGAFVRMEEYSLDAVARDVLGEGKTLDGDLRDRAGEIMQRYRQDLPGFALYARTDARLALDIVNRLDLMNLAFARSRLTGMTPDRVAASIASFDFLYLSSLGQRDLVAPTVRSDDSRVHAAQSGGQVFEPVTGVHRNVMVFDFKSLYPSIMRTFNVDPLGFVPSGREEPDVIRLVNGAGFRRGPAILPRMLDDLFPRREAAKAAGDSVASQAIKILMNSFYGVLGTPACRFHNVEIANAITGQGRHLLQWSKRWFEARGFDVLYGDTDSLFVRSAQAGVDAALAEANDLAAQLNADVAADVRERWGVVSRLELEFEKLYAKLFLPSVRHGAAGARKRYAGLPAGADEVEFVGMEVVRRDWTELAKQVQRELYARLFSNAAVDDYLADVVARLRRGELDELLVYRKGLRKRLDSYTASNPPHVAAARKSEEPPGRTVAYLVTTAGPEPLDALQHEPDREHYVDKQIKPVAEPVLASLGLDFARVIGDDRQMGLF